MLLSPGEEEVYPFFLGEKVDTGEVSRANQVFLDRISVEIPKVPDEVRTKSKVKARKSVKPKKGKAGRRKK